MSLSRGSKASGEAVFVIDVADSYGEVLKTLQTTLKGKWLEKPLATALLEPACNSSGFGGQGWDEVPLDGVRIDERAPAKTFAGDGSKATKIRLTLEARVGADSGSHR